MEKRFAITGATGLLGSNLVNYLINFGHDVSVLIKDQNSRSILNSSVNKIYGDISDKHDIEFFIQKSNPTHFIHLAAQTQAYDSLKYPYQTFYNNVVGTLNILESLREFGNCKAILVASSDKAYGELTNAKYLENHPLNGVYPYDASKSATDIVSNSYRKTYGMPIIVTRACNMYGIGDYNRQRLIPGIVYAHLKKTDFVIRNAGIDSREYVHVDDVVNAYEGLLDYAENNNKYGAFNISSGDVYKTIDLFHLVENAIGASVKHEVVNNTSLEIKKQIMDSTLLKNETGWLPRKNLKSSISEIVYWYKNNI
jgi:CDP-glucose 4,6-dehydratase